jgi:hypothetical protein
MIELALQEPALLVDYIQHAWEHANPALIDLLYCCCILLVFGR